MQYLPKHFLLYPAEQPVMLFLTLKFYLYIFILLVVHLTSSHLILYKLGNVFCLLNENYLHDGYHIG